MIKSLLSIKTATNNAQFANAMSDPPRLSHQPLELLVCFEFLTSYLSCDVLLFKRIVLSKVADKHFVRISDGNETPQAFCLFLVAAHFSPTNPTKISKASKKQEGSIRTMLQGDKGYGWGTEIRINDVSRCFVFRTYVFHFCFLYWKPV